MIGHATMILHSGVVQLLDFDIMYVGSIQEDSFIAMEILVF